MQADMGAPAFGALGAALFALDPERERFIWERSQILYKKMLVHGFKTFGSAKNST